jgi:hypothetical protein
VHITAYPILDDLVDEDILVLRCLNPTGKFGQAGGLPGPKPPLACDDAVDVLFLVVADGDGLEDTKLPYRAIQLLLRGRIVVAAWLIRIRLNFLDGDQKGASKPPTGV